MSDNKEFKSSYFLRLLKGDFNPFTPNILSIDSNHIEYRRRNWYLISVDTENLHFQNITGVSVDKHLFGATLLIKSTGNDPIMVHGFWKKAANEIRDLCAQNISENTQRGTTEAMAEAISRAVGQANTGPEPRQASVAEELRKLKDLLDEGVITEEEFEKQKKRLLD